MEQSGGIYPTDAQFADSRATGSADGVQQEVCLRIGEAAPVASHSDWLTDSLRSASNGGLARIEDDDVAGWARRTLLAQSF